MTISSSRRRFLQGSALAGGMGALAACGQKSADERSKEADKSNDEAIKEASQLPSTAWERADYSAVKDGGTLTIAVLQMPDNWNTQQADGSLGALSQMLDPQTGSLKASEKGEVSLNKDYIESAEVTKEDPLTITVKYNSKGVWSDGQPIVIADLISQWKALNGSNKAFQTGFVEGWDKIKDIRQTTDAYTGEIEYSEHYGDWITKIHPDLPQSVTKDPDTFNKGFVSTPTPSYGPFVVTNVDQNAQVVTLGRNPKWWGRAPKLEKIIFKVVSQDQQPSSFANGELDYLDIATGDVLSQAKSRKDASIQRTNGLAWSHVTMNVKGANGALGDEQVRKAMAYAINRKAIGQAVVAPLEAPVITQNNFIFMPGQEGYEDSFGGLKHDPKMAEKILDDAGWKKNGDVREKDGKKLEMSVLVPSGVKSNSDRALQIQNDLNAIGFKVQLKTVPPDAYFKEYVNKKNFDMVTFTWGGTLFPISLGISPFYPVTSASNYTNYDGDAELKPFVTEMLGGTDQAKRREAANKFSKAVASHYTIIPFYATPNIVGVKKGLVNYGASQFENADWTQVGYKA